MKNTPKDKRVRSGLSIILLLVLRVAAQQASEHYYLYLTNHPEEENPGWHQEVQGIGHDSEHWFITQRERLWKIPVSINLTNRVASGVGGVQAVGMNDFPDLAGYNHFGDLETYSYDGQTYVLVPVQSEHGIPRPAVGVFRAADLSFVARAFLWSQEDAA